MNQRIGGIGKGWIIVLPRRRNPFAHGLFKICIAPAANAKFFIRADIGRVKNTKRGFNCRTAAKQWAFIFGIRVAIPAPPCGKQIGPARQGFRRWPKSQCMTGYAHNKDARNKDNYEPDSTYMKNKAVNHGSRATRNPAALSSFISSLA